MIKVGLDKNGDGFICMDAKAGDPLNQLPEPLDLAQLTFEVTGSASAATDALQTDYGLQVFAITYIGLNIGAHHLGKNGTTINTIPVRANTTYTLGVWVRGITDYTAYPLTLRVFNQTSIQLGSSVQGHITEWSRQTVTLTTGANDTHVYFAMEKPAGHPAMKIETTGYLFVIGTTLPDGFNTGAASDLDDFITSDVLTMDWNLGFARAYDVVSAPTRGTIMLRNDDGDYAPEHTGISLNPGTPVRVRMTHNSQTYVMFTGLIDRVEPKGRTTALHLIGPEDHLKRHRIAMPLITNGSAKDVIKAALAQPALDRFNRLLDTGVSTFAYVGDTWSDGIRAHQVIAHVVEAERGRFFSNRKGEVIFYDRNHLDTSPAIDATFVDDYEALTYVYGDALINQVRVRVRPRQVGSAGSVIWQLSTPQRVKTGECVTFTAHLHDLSGNPVGVIRVIPPVKRTDYRANTAADGSGADVTAQFTMTIPTEGVRGSAVILDVCNTSGSNAYLLAQTRLRGTPLIQGDSLLIEQTNFPSALAYGLNSLMIDLSVLGTTADAKEFAQAKLDAFAAPFGAVQSITLGNRSHYNEALSLGLFDAITITDSDTGHSANYYIIAEKHTLSHGGYRHQVTWLLEPVDPANMPTQ